MITLYLLTCAFLSGTIARMLGADAGVTAVVAAGGAWLALAVLYFTQETDE